MTDRPKFFDDLAGMAGGAMSALNGLRDESSALIKAKVDETVRRLDLVKREEFDAMAEMAANARAEVAALAARIERLEGNAVAAASAPVSDHPVHEAPTHEAPTHEAPGLRPESAQE